MRKLLVVLCVLGQLLLLGGMVISRESVVRNGEQLLLRTAPIDPRDPFRGDFVRLQYPMNSTANVVAQWSSPDIELHKGDKVYAVLTKTPGAVHEVAYLTDVKPEGRLFITGRISSASFNQISVSNRQSHSIKYGIEQFFVEQGAGIAIEQKQGVRGGMQVPLDMQVAVGKNGTAIITGHQWSPLGVELTFANAVAATAENTEDGNSAQSDIATDLQNRTIVVALTNVSEQVLMLNDPGQHCGFRIEQARFYETSYSQAYKGCDRTMASNLITLGANETYTINIDLADARWQMLDSTGEPFDVRTLNTNYFFRIVYQTPTNTDTSENETVWVGELPSRAFNRRANFD